MNITFNVANFRAAFPAFATNLTKYPDAALNNFFDLATLFISNQYQGGFPGFTPVQQAAALNYMVAHLAALNDIIVKKSTPGVLTGATIDKISVTLQPPPESNQWQWWLNQTAYGQQLLAMLQVISVGGYYAGGSAALSAFRGPGGFW